MKKFLAIFVLIFLFNGNANAGVNEPGSGPITSIEAVKNVHKQQLEEAKKKKSHLIYYVSTNEGGNWAGWAFYAKKINEKSHKKAYKSCLKVAKKRTRGEDCYLFAVNEEQVWKYDKAKESVKAKAKLAKTTAKKEKLTQIDKKPGRFFEDQPDVNDDYQIHFNYLLASDSKDREWDINGKMEKILLRLNKFMLTATAGHKYSGGLGKKYKFDFRKDGKLDITFIRLDTLTKNLHKYPNENIIPFFWKTKEMKNPKKIYYNFVDVGGIDGGEAGVGLGSSFLKNKHVNSVKNKIITITLHELHHTQGGGFPCVPGVGTNAHYTSDNSYQLGHGLKLGPTYIHDVEACPELVDSVYLTPTSDQPYDPYQLACKKDLGVYNHPKIVKLMKEKQEPGSGCKWRRYLPAFSG